MAKQVQSSHITGESGVIKFKEYCNKHKPFIIFREISTLDYGTDGEIELVKFDHDKLIASGKVIKIQLKSTASDNSYMRNVTDIGFTFYASKDDFEYWAEHNLGVILVIYDVKSDRLFAKKITKEEFAFHKKHSKGNQYPVDFKFDTTELYVGEGTFFEKIDISYFKPRIDYNIKETLISNIHTFSSFPKKMFVYETKLANKKSVFAKLDEGMTLPPFVLYNKKIYSFIDIAFNHKTFREAIVNGNKAEQIFYSDFFEDQPIRNHYTELLNLYLKQYFTKTRRLWQNRHQKSNYFFSKPYDGDELKISYKTRKRGSSGERLVVKYYQYGKDTFFRHLGFVYYIDFIDEIPALLLNYKYHFTTDGYITLPPLKTTSYTNKLTSREFNEHVLNHHYFWFEYLSNGNHLIDVEINDDFKIRIKPPEELKTDFGIYKPKNLQPSNLKKDENPNNDYTQATLF